MKKVFTRYVTLSFALLVLVFLMNGCGGSDDPLPTKRPIVFVHGSSGSAAQFESQAQRFIANGYPLSYLAVYEHDTGTGAPTPANQVIPLDTIINTMLAKTGADKVELIGHSRGTSVSQAYLSDPIRAAKVARYVNVDGATALSLPGNVPTLAIWADGWLGGAGPPADPYARKIVGATNFYILDQAHTQVCTSPESFAEMFRFFNGRSPSTVSIPVASGVTVEIAGKAAYFPQNTGALGTLEIYEIHPITARRIGTPVVTYTIGATGEWGPLTITKGATYEFAFEHAGALGKHYFYREPFMANDYFVRLNTSNPLSPSGLGNFLTKTANHTNIVVTRDKEMWGNQGADNDIVLVDGYSVMTAQAAARTKHLSALFLLDWGPVAPANGLPNSAPWNNPAYYAPHVLGGCPRTQSRKAIFCQKSLQTDKIIS